MASEWNEKIELYYEIWLATHFSSKILILIGTIYFAEVNLESMSTL